MLVCYNKRMSSFSSQIQKLEHNDDNTYEIKKGRNPVIITSAHGIGQKRHNNKFKLAEPYTRGIAKYVSRKTNCYYLIKNEDTGTDSNKINRDDFKIILSDLISKNKIKMMIDLHGAKKERDFDIEIGTLSGKMVRQETISRLINCLKEVGINNIVLDDPFKGGQISQMIYNNTGIECIQLEINYNYRNIRKIRNLKKICSALVRFIQV